MSDGEVSKLLIVTQTPQRPKKHEGFDRTADSVSRVKMSQVRGLQCAFIHALGANLVFALGWIVNRFRSSTSEYIVQN